MTTDTQEVARARPAASPPEQEGYLALLHADEHSEWMWLVAEATR